MARYRRQRAAGPDADYLPDTLIGSLHRPGGIDHTAAIAMRHLRGHASGLADWLEGSPSGGRSPVERLIAEGYRSLPLDELLFCAHEQLTPHFPPQPLDARRPKLRYCDTNHILLIASILGIQPTSKAIAAGL